MDKKNVIKLSKYLSLLLRHQPGLIGLELDENGWAKVDELIEKSLKKGKRFNLDDLKFVVKNDDKQRYTFNEDGTKIRANQGHSIRIDLQLNTKEPPEKLYHGTATRNLESILENGINKGNRTHVHLSLDVGTAKKVGKRHGQVVVLEIQSGKMYADGIQFYLSKNNVWLTDYVSPEYILENSK